MQPTLEKILVDHRGPTSSADFNKFQEAALYDITKLFNIAAEHGIQIPLNMEIVMTENCFLQMRLAELEGQLADIEANLAAGDKHTASLHFNDPSQVYYEANGYTAISEERKARVSGEYGIATLPGSFTSKTGLVDGSGSVVIPPTLGVSTRITLDPNASFDTIEATYDPSMLHMFDGLVDTYWTNTVATPDTTVSKARCRLEIAVPQDITNNLLANSIALRPYPEYGLTITDIQYMDATNTWQRLPTFPTSNNQPVPVTTLKRTQFIFAPKQIVRLRIDMEQPFWFSEAGRRVFRFGMQEVGLSYYDYRRSGILLAKLVLPAKTFARVDSITPYTGTGTPSDIGQTVKTKLYIPDPTTGALRSYALGYPLPGGINTIYAEMALTPDAFGVSPGVSRLEVNYTTA